MIKKELHEREKRTDLVIGIFLSAILAFIINLLANIFYNSVIQKSVEFDDLNRPIIGILIISLIAFINFLIFLIEDYKNELKFDKPLFKRFLKYFFYKNEYGILLRRITGVYLLIYILIIYIGFSLSIIISMNSLLEKIGTIIFILVITIGAILNEQRKMRNN